MSGIIKTKNLLRLDIPVHLLEKNEDNPNRMSSREFDLLCDNIEKTGITDPILVRPLSYTQVHDLAEVFPKPADLIANLMSAGARFRIVGGHHRFDASVYLGFEAVPCTVIMDPDFDSDQEKFQIVRMNMIRGKLDGPAFMSLVQSLNDSYAEEVLQEAFGFSDQRLWDELVNQTAKALPDPALQKKFKEAAVEVKTIDGLSKLLNTLYTKYGDTVPYGYMVLDYGGQRSVWCRIGGPTMKALDLLGEVCIDRQRTMDDLIGGVVRLLAKGDLPEVLEQLIQSSPETAIPASIQVLPTQDNLDTMAAL